MINIAILGYGQVSKIFIEKIKKNLDIMYFLEIVAHQSLTAFELSDINLYSEKKQEFLVKDEAVNDTLIDMANYAILGYVLCHFLSFQSLYHIPVVLFPFVGIL